MSYKLKTLVIDDENLIRKSLHLACQKRGHEVFSAGEGKEGLKLWLSFHPDLIFLDLLLPDGNGLHLLRQVPKELRSTCVILSAHDQLGIEEVRQAGADLFIQKPFPSLFQMIEDLENFVLKKRKGMEKHENY